MKDAGFTLGEKPPFKYGDIVIPGDTPGLKEKLAEIIECAEKEFPSDMAMQDYKICENLKAFAKIAGLKAKLLELGKTDEDALRRSD